MPSVGRKKFPYTASGEAAATNYGQQTGQRVVKKKMGDEGMPFVPASKRAAGMGDEGRPLRPGGKGKGDEGMALRTGGMKKKKVGKKPPRRMK